MGGTVVTKKLGTFTAAANPPIEMPADLIASLFQMTAYVEYSAGTSAGTILIESAARPGYGGTWALEATLAFGAASSVKAAHIQGNHNALRARCTADPTGGTMDVYITGMR